MFMYTFTEVYYLLYLETFSGKVGEVLTGKGGKV